MDNELNIAWAAGLFEGEGTVADNGVHSIRASITSTDVDVLFRLKEATSLGSIYKTSKSQEHHKQAWVWVVNGEDAYEFLVGILPYMLNRRSERIQSALDRYGNGLRIQLERIATRKRILELWETGSYTERQIGEITGTNRSYVNAVRFGKMKTE